MLQWDLPPSTATYLPNKNLRVLGNHYTVERGFEPDTSTSTVIAVEAPHNVNDHRSTNAEELLGNNITHSFNSRMQQQPCSWRNLSDNEP